MVPEPSVFAIGVRDPASGLSALGALGNGTKLIGEESERGIKGFSSGYCHLSAEALEDLAMSEFESLKTQTSNGKVLNDKKRPVNNMFTVYIMSLQCCSVVPELVTCSL